MQEAIALAHHSKFRVGGVYRREVFERIGLFDEELVRNQDDEFNLRLVQHSSRIWHSPRIRSWHSPRQSLTALFRQYV